MAGGSAEDRSEGPPGGTFPQRVAYFGAWLAGLGLATLGPTLLSIPDSLWQPLFFSGLAFAGGALLFGMIATVSGGIGVVDADGRRVPDHKGSRRGSLVLLAGIVLLIGAAVSFLSGFANNWH